MPITKSLSNLASKLLPEVSSIQTSVSTTNTGSYRLDACQLDTVCIDRQKISNDPVEAYIVALGSNFEAEKNLAIARSALEALACDMQWSSLLVNPDYTASKDNPKPDYTNQCGVLTLSPAMTFQTLQDHSKRIEQRCKRLIVSDGNSDSNLLSQTNRIVSVDIDILAVSVSNKWHIIKQRYPFKEHEMIGIREIISQ